MDDLGGPPPIFGNTHISVCSNSPRFFGPDFHGKISSWPIGVSFHEIAKKKSAGWSLSKKILTGAMVHFADCRLYKHRLLAGENSKLWEIDSQPKMSGKPLEKAINAKMV